jgi:hypothetical protein
MTMSIKQSIVWVDNDKFEADDCGVLITRVAVLL